MPSTTVLAPAAMAVFVALAALAPAAHAAAKVEVSFLPSDKYTDVGVDPFTRDRNLKDIGEWVQRLGEATLPDGDALTIAFTDIDLAGRPNWAHRDRGDYRIMSGQADWPRMRLHWTLKTPGQPDRGGDAALSDMNYLWGVRPVGSDRPMYYDKHMFSEWFAKTFGIARKDMPRAADIAP